MGARRWTHILFALIGTGVLGYLCFHKPYNTSRMRGSYNYSVGVDGVGESPIIFSYTLRLSPDNDAEPCILEIDGHLTMNRFNCKIVTKKRKTWDIVFISARQDNVHGAYGKEGPLMPGDILLTLYYNNSDSLQFAWQKLGCDFKDAKTNHLFTKMSDSPKDEIIPKISFK